MNYSVLNHLALNHLAHKIIVITGIFLIGLNSLHAETPSIAVVDLQRVLEESIVGKASKANLDQSLKTSKARIEIEQGKLQQMQAELQKQKALLSPEAWGNRRTAFMKAERDFQRLASDAQEDIQRKTAQAIQKIMEEVTAIAAKIAKDKGYDFIIEKDMRLVLFADSRIDLSAAVIAQLDQSKLKL